MVATAEVARNRDRATPYCASALSCTFNLANIAIMPNRPKNSSHDRESLFKYISRDAAVAVLNSRSLRWSSAASFNDPFDMRFDLYVDIDQPKVRDRCCYAC